MGGKTAPANGHAGANGAAHGIAYTALPSGDDRDAEAALPLPRAKPLSLLPLIALIFFDVSGGPFGTEVRSEPFRRALAGSRLNYDAVYCFWHVFWLMHPEMAAGCRNCAEKHDSTSAAIAAHNSQQRNCCSLIPT